MNPYDPDGRPWWQPHRQPAHVDPIYTIEGDSAANGYAGLTILADGQPSRLFMRRAIKNALGANSPQIAWLVGELEGVRCYLARMASGRVSVVLTRRDLYP